MHMESNSRMNKKPKCAIEGCQNDASVIFGGRWVCGECLMRWHKNSQDKMFRELEEANGKRDMSAM